MKFFVALSCLLAVACAIEEVQVLRNELDVSPDSYNYAYELGNGISAQESGNLKNTESITAQGKFSYTSPEGNPYVVDYVADENGFQPTGAHLPVAPEVPVLIQKALAYLATAQPYVEKN